MFDKSPFEIFNLKPEFTINQSELEQQYIALQSRYHPDKHIGKTPEEMAEATVNASLINNAYKTLTNPLTRAGLLVGEAESQDPQILMEAMELRESIESAKDLNLILEEVNNKITTLEDRFDAAFKQGKQAQLNKLYLQMQYLYKAKIEIKNRLVR